MPLEKHDSMSPKCVARAAVLLWLTLGPAAAGEFPRELVEWSEATTGPVFQGAGNDAWDRKIRERGYILVEDGSYRLWYTGYNDDRSPTKFLGLATSPDGLHWTRDRANPLFNESWVEDVCVVRQGGQYLMFAEGKNDIAHQMTSPDGLRWTDLGPLDVRLTDGRPIPAGPYGTPTAWFEGGTWYLFYERSDRGVWLATSTDRRVWTNVRDSPVLDRGPWPYDREAVAINQVFKRDGTYYAIYHAAADRPWKDWTTNIARSRDLVHWEKYPGNPIVGNNCSSGILVQTPEGDRLYTMHPEVRVFESRGSAEVKKKISP
jgi:beta-1,2-mannobiose phosphorylase / 1,2-beta-oligomannan phosphorylase